MEWLWLHLSSAYIVSSVGFPHGTNYFNLSSIYSSQYAKEKQREFEEQELLLSDLVTPLPLSRIFWVRLTRTISSKHVIAVIQCVDNMCFGPVLRPLQSLLLKWRRLLWAILGTQHVQLQNGLLKSTQTELKLSATNCNSYVKSHYFICSPPEKLPIMRPQELCFSNEFFKAIYVKITVLGMAEVC